MNAKLLFLSTLFIGLTNPMAMADSLSGDYKVQSCTRAEVLQSGTHERIDVTSYGFEQKLDTNGQAPTPFVSLLNVAFGDVIRRPTSTAVMAGFTLVDRQISSVDANQTKFTFVEYVYDMNLSDDEGLATTPFKSITIEAVGTNLTYDLSYHGTENYHCVLIRK